jgi:hypothetical protein
LVLDEVVGFTAREVAGMLDWRGFRCRARSRFITTRGSEIAALTRFESHSLHAFGLPRVLPDA